MAGKLEADESNPVHYKKAGTPRKTASFNPDTDKEVSKAKAAEQKRLAAVEDEKIRRGAEAALRMEDAKVSQHGWKERER